jgi:hypothetical protein
MASTVNQDRQGPDWPLGFIALVTPGTPVSIMSLVDAALVNDPGALTSTTSNEFTVRCQQIFFMGFKPGVSTRLVNNSGNIYICRKNTTGTTDTGVILKTLVPGESFFLGSSAMNRNVYNPYRYYIDGDTAGDGALVTLIMQ